MFLDLYSANDANITLYYFKTATAWKQISIVKGEIYTLRLVQEVKGMKNLLPCPLKKSQKLFHLIYHLLRSDSFW